MSWYFPQADWGGADGRKAAAPSYGEAEAEEEGSKSMVLTTHTIMRVRRLALNGPRSRRYFVQQQKKNVP